MTKFQKKYIVRRKRMTKTTVTEIIEEYDKDGKLVKKTTKTEKTEDDTQYFPSYTGTSTIPVSTLSN